MNYAYTAANTGATAATVESLVHRTASGADAPVSGAPATIPANSSGVAAGSSSYDVPGNQPDGELSDVTTLRWRDVNGNAYGPVSDTTTTTIFSAVTLPSPRLSGTVATPFGDQVRFLYVGADAVQSGVVNGTIDSSRVAAIRGRVITPAGVPVAGVQVTIPGHGEYGSTTTRSDGSLYMVVNGGTTLRVRFEKTGLLSSERTIEVPVQDWAMLDDVALVAMDPQATVVDFGIGTFDAQVARGSQVTDGDGSRRATIIFQPGTTATMHLPGGGTQTASQLTLHATEFTVGDRGPEAMPATLPLTSAYTFAADFSAEEAVAAGASSVDFSKPASGYVENFLGFPVGKEVPSGAYDSTKGAWTASANGRVVKVISVTSGVADLDVSGNGQPATSGELAALGITNEERIQLAALYQPEQQLWRVPMSHFSLWDWNPPFGLAADAKAPPDDPQGSPKDEPAPDPCGAKGGSTIECENQTLREDVGLPGAPFGLHYTSDRAAGRAAARTIRIKATGAQVPQSLQGVVVHVDVAGRRYTETLPPQPNQFFTYTWDGKDAFGRPAQGQRPATVRLGYAYKGVYMAGGPSSAFGDTSDIEFQVLSRNVIFAWRTTRYNLGNWDARQEGLGGWSLDAHQVYDPLTKTLLLGDGTRRHTENVDSLISTIAGGNGGTFSGDGGPATQAQINEPHDLTYGPDGSLYVADSRNNRIRKIDRQGTITTVAGNGADGYSGDGGPATQASITFPESMAVAPDGSIYISSVYDHVVRRVSPAGTISTVAGTGAWACGVDDVAGAQSAMRQPAGLEMGPDGSLYIADAYCMKVRKLRPDGTITTVAGGGMSETDGAPARQAYLNYPRMLALARDGTLYVGESDSFARVKKVTPDGKVFTVAYAGGADPWDNRDEASALDLRSRATGLAIGPDDRLYMSDVHNRVRRLDSDGMARTVVGTGQDGNAALGDGGPARKARLWGPFGLEFAPDGSMVVSTGLENRVRRVASALPGFASQEIAVPSQDGEQLYQFDGNGRHLRTVNTRTGATVYTFSYDAEGRLTSIRDGDNDVTTVERTPSGAVRGITGPFGQRAAVELGPDGMISRITSAAGRRIDLTYGSGGLLQSLTDPNRNSAQMSYDSLGRLISDADAASGTKTLSRTDATRSYETTVTTGLGRTTRHGVERLANDSLRRTFTDAAGKTTTATTTSTGDRSVTHPDGMSTSATIAPEPRFGLQAPLVSGFDVTSPGGRHLAGSASRQVTLANPGDLLSLQTLTDTLTVNGRNSTSAFNRAQRRYTDTTAAGRTVRTDVDIQGRPTATTVGGLYGVNTSYDSHGRAQHVQQGFRGVDYTYDDRGRLATTIEPLGLTTHFAYDADGRLLSQTLPDGRTVGYAYDANGNVTAVTPPGRPSHAFSLTPIGLTSTYTAPSVGDGANPTRYSYNADHQPATITRADDSTVSFSYDAAGRPTTLTHPDGAVDYGYDAQAGRLSSIDVAGAGPGLSLGYDGRLLTRETATGPAAGEVTRSYDNDLRIDSTSVNGADPVTYAYDADSLLTRAGGLTLIRRADNGMIASTTLGTIGTTRAYDSYGDPQTLSAAAGSNALFSAMYVRDELGRIGSVSETVEGVSTAWGYTFDAAGRLTDVGRDGTPYAHYEYDSSGNRLSTTSSDGSTTTAAYDSQDRLVSFGGATYGYTRNGELQSKTQGSQTTTYRYDALGALTRVTKPGGTVIDYVTDGLGRRVAKKVDGTLLQGYLYGSEAMGPTAELNPDGSVRTRFVYATRANVPDYMVRDGVSYRFVLDHLGSVRLVVNASTGSIAQRLDYSPLGDVTADTDPGFQPFGYAGGLYDQDTKLVRFGARDYDAHTGRFTTKDPIGFKGGDTNLYGYVLNDPINGTDASGLMLDPSFVDFALDFTSRRIKEASQTTGLSGRAREAVVYYAALADNSDSPLTKTLATLGGTLSSLAVCENIDTTVLTLATSGAGIEFLAARGEQGLSWMWKTRPGLGADGGRSTIGIERAGGDAISRAHQVTVDGKVVHQHQTHIGKYGGQRQFPDDWVQFPRVESR